MGDPIGVLVVDDDFMVAEIHAELVSQVEGFEVRGSAHTGRQVLQMVPTAGVELVLLDLHLPDMNGIEVLRRIRARGDDVDVIVVTAERDASFVRAALRGGASQYLVKPFDIEDLRSRLETYRATGRSLRGRLPDQAAVDSAFRRPHERSRERAPKGLSAESVALVVDALAAGGEMSARECAAATGMARVSVRRYLEHFVETGQATVRLKYGGGRPERRYSLADGATP